MFADFLHQSPFEPNPVRRSSDGWHDLDTRYVLR